MVTLCSNELSWDLSKNVVKWAPALPQAVVGSDGVDGDGAADAATCRQDRGGHRAAPGGALPPALPNRAQVCLQMSFS